ncbi:MAG: transcriptional antiterminator, BglG [Sporolactobacillus laevolacticus]|jgi:transcriptional antiterminator|nr:transcriptional antiterminator, BglG [Sporolactobacillus laevolacticus]
MGLNMKALTDLTDVKESKIIKFILTQKKTHYADISNYMNLSRKTISKYLDRISETVKPFGIKLVRKQNDGIYFEGNMRPLMKPLVNSEEGIPIPSTKNERILYIFSKLLMNSDYVTIQQLADELFVSRSTVEADLKSVKTYLEKYAVSLERSQCGIRIKTIEKSRRDLISKLIKLYWGKNSYVKKKDGILTRTIQLPNDLTNLIDKQTLNQVISTVDVFCDQSKLEFTDYEFQSLVIHLVIAIERIRKDKFLSTHETKHELLPNTVLLIDLLQKKFQIKIPEQEKNYINIHMIAVQRKSDTKDEFSRAGDGFSEDRTLANFLRKSLQDSSYDDDLIQGLTLHLSSALKRLKLGLTIFNPYSSEIKRFFPEAFEYAIRLKADILQTYGIDLNEDETAFVALHIETFLERHKYNQEVNAVVVCSSGIGTSRLLEQRINKYFANEIKVTRVLSLQELMETVITEDLIISTINIDFKHVPVIVVSPFLEAQDITMIKRTEQSLRNQEDNRDCFVKLLDPRLIFIHSNSSSQTEAIRFIGEKLISFKYAKSGIVESALNREAMSNTAFHAIAIPHAKIDYVVDPCIAVLISKDGIKWGEELVNIVFFIALNQKVEKEIRTIYERFNDIIEDHHILKKLKDAEQVQDVLALLKGSG